MEFFIGPDAQCAVDGCVQIRDGDGPILDLHRQFVGHANGLTVFETAASGYNTERAGVVSTTSTGVKLCRPTKLGSYDDQRLVEQLVFFEIEHE